MPRLPSTLPRKSISVLGHCQSRPLSEQGASWPSRGNPCMPRLSRSPGEPLSCVHCGGLPASPSAAICLGGGCFWEATGAALQKPTVSLPLSRRLWVSRGNGCTSGHLLLACHRPLQLWARAFSRMICTHPSKTGPFDHRLGITNNKKEKT